MLTLDSPTSVFSLFVLSSILKTMLLQIYKRGANVRIDTTLVDFDVTSNWKRGNQSFMFRFSDNFEAQFVVLDHNDKTVNPL